MADLTPKGSQTQSAPEGGIKTLTMMIMMIMMIMMMMMMMRMRIKTMTMMIVICFFIPKDLIQGWHLGGPINYDDDDNVDDNDVDDNDDDQPFCQYSSKMLSKVCLETVKLICSTDNI